MVFILFAAMGIGRFPSVVDLILGLSFGPFVLGAL